MSQAHEHAERLQANDDEQIQPEHAFIVLNRTSIRIFSNSLDFECGWRAILRHRRDAAFSPAR
jgi:hypothetical protein